MDNFIFKKIVAALLTDFKAVEAFDKLLYCASFTCSAF